MTDGSINKTEFASEHMVNFFRYCPHCGSDRFVAVSFKEMKCRSCGFDYFPNAAAAVACIIVDDEGRIMLTRRARDPWKGKLDLPGGFVDPCESVESALKRELREELDVEVVRCKYLASYPNKYVFSGYEVNTTDLGFICKINHTDKIQAKDDISSIEWYLPEEIPFSEIPAPSIRNIINTYIKNKW